MAVPRCVPTAWDGVVVAWISPPLDDTVDAGLISAPAADDDAPGEDVVITPEVDAVEDGVGSWASPMEPAADSAVPVVLLSVLCPPDGVDAEEEDGPDPELELVPSSAWAMAVPLASEAPMPKVRAPAPNHA